MCCLPHANADCERVFSALKLIKTRLRSRLLAGTLVALMRCKLNAAQFDMDVVSWQPSKGFLVGAAQKLRGLWRAKNEAKRARQLAREAAEAAEAAGAEAADADADEGGQEAVLASVLLENQGAHDDGGGAGGCVDQAPGELASVRVKIAGVWGRSPHPIFFCGFIKGVCGVISFALKLSATLV